MTQHRYFFDSHTANEILTAIKTGKREIRLSLDLNLSRRAWAILEDKLILDEERSVDIEMITPISSAENKIFELEKDKMRPLEVRSHGYYKLVPSSSAPTLEIDGIKMHRSKDIDPLTDAKLKTQLVVCPGDTVLDTCGGLGYSAIFALKAGAKKVISFEKSKEVIHLRNLNPWLEKYADERLELTYGDITEQMDILKEGAFNSVIHDPPRFTSATGDLYGKKFYDALFRCMALGARLFHYTGSPKKIKTQDKFIKNAMKRLENSGFAAIKFHENLQGIYGQKN